MIFFITRKRLRQLADRSFARGYDKGVSSGYRLGWNARAVENRNRDTVSPKFLKEIDDIAKDGGL